MTRYATPDEVATVDKKIRKIRRRLFYHDIKKNASMYMTAPAPQKTDQTFWLSKYTDPYKIYQGNTDHWAKRRVEAADYVAKELRKKSKEKVPLPESGCTVAPFTWTPQSAQSLRVNDFKEKVDQILKDGIYPGDLNAEIRSRQRNRKSEGWPKDTKAYRAAVWGDKYWPQRDVTLKMSQPRRDRNDLPI